MTAEPVPAPDDQIVELGSDKPRIRENIKGRLRDYPNGDPGEILVVGRPKTGLLLRLAQKAARLPDMDTDDATALDPEALDLFDYFLDHILNPDDAALFRTRMDDPDDDVDLDDLLPLMDVIRERWSARPTGRGTASRPSSKGRGRRSTARAR